MDDLLKKLQQQNHNGNSIVDSAWVSQFLQNCKDVSESERKTAMQLDELRSKLLEKETELSLLQADINMLSADRDNKIVDMEGLSTQLMVMGVDNETSLEKIQQLESELEALRLKNNQLSEDLLKKSEQIRNYESTVKTDKTGPELQGLQAKVKDLESQLKNMETESIKLAQETKAVESEREEEVRAMQNALDDAIEAKIKIQNKYEREFEDLRTTFSSQEQQLLEDFEWKLRQIESSSKKKLQDKDLQVEEKLREARLLESKEVGAEKEQLRQEKRYVEEQLKHVNHLKSYEAEVVQLRGLTHEQQRSLRAASRQLEHFKFNDKYLQEELRAARVALEKEKTHSQVIQSSNQRRLDAQEEIIQAKLDKQWEEKITAEANRLKEDLNKLHAEEKHLAVETMKLQKDHEYSLAKQSWDRKKEELLQDISRLNDTITQKDSVCHREVEKVTSQADRDSWEMRRQLEKLNNAHMEQMEKLKESHADEIGRLTASFNEYKSQQYEKALERIKELESKLKLVETIQQQQKQKQNEEKPHSTGALILPESGPIPISLLQVQVTPNHRAKNDSDSSSEEEDDEEDETESSGSDESDEEGDVQKNGIDENNAKLKNIPQKLPQSTNNNPPIKTLTKETAASASGTSLVSASTSATSETSGMTSATESSESDEDDD